MDWQPPFPLAWLRRRAVSGGAGEGRAVVAVVSAVLRTAVDRVNRGKSAERRGRRMRAERPERRTRGARASGRMGCQIRPQEFARPGRRRARQRAGAEDCDRRVPAATKRRSTRSPGPRDDDPDRRGPRHRLGGKSVVVQAVLHPVVLHGETLLDRPTRSVNKPRLPLPQASSPATSSSSRHRFMGSKSRPSRRPLQANPLLGPTGRDLRHYSFHRGLFGHAEKFGARRDYIKRVTE